MDPKGDDGSLLTLSLTHSLSILFIALCWKGDGYGCKSCTRDTGSRKRKFSVDDSLEIRNIVISRRNIVKKKFQRKQLVSYVNITQMYMYRVHLCICFRTKNVRSLFFHNVLSASKVDV